MAETPENPPPSLPEKGAAAYRVLARKYRPLTFDDLIGQDAMVRTLRNAFEAGRIPQAWMLTGVRGVGKTTTARIVARALNYKTDVIDTPTIALEGEGEHCRAIIEGRHVDVIEMDAASHTGIDDIKQIIDQARYAPLAARFKVFIIDEVHMISEKAFNALLKTLEEPPAHAKFIFATTEIRKVPVTILSRCQRFDLRRVDASVLADHLGRIVTQEGVSASPEALAMIARAGEGSVRDALSILDQAIAHGNGQVEAPAVRDMLGLADRTRTIELYEHLVAGRAQEALAELGAQYHDGADPAVVLEDLASFNHLVTRKKIVGADTPGGETEEERTRGHALAEKLSVPLLSRMWQMLLKGIGETRDARRPLEAAEMVLIRLCHAADLPGPEEALKRLESNPPTTDASPNRAASGGSTRPPAGGSQAVSRQSLSVAPSSNGSQMRLVASKPDPAPRVPQSDPEDAAAAEPATITCLEDIAALADRNRDLQFKVLLKQFVRPVRFASGRIEIALVESAPPSLQLDLAERLEKWTGSRIFVSVAEQGGGQTLAERETAARAATEADALNDPEIAAVMNRFPGATIIRISDRDDDLADPSLNEASGEDISEDD